MTDQAPIRAEALPPAPVRTCAIVLTRLGEPALYPFVISVKAAQKLRLAHHYAQVWGLGGRKTGEA